MSSILIFTKLQLSRSVAGATVARSVANTVPARNFSSSAVSNNGGNTNNHQGLSSLFSILNSILNDASDKSRSTRDLKTAAAAKAEVKSLQNQYAEGQAGSAAATSIREYKASTAPSGVPLMKIFNVRFPLSIKASFADYRRRHELLGIQKELLSVLRIENLTNLEMNVLKVPIPIDDEGRVVKLDQQGKLSHAGAEKVDHSNYINEVCISPKNVDLDDKSVRHLVLIHGYGAGLGFFIKNLEKLSVFLNENKSQKWAIHAIDLLGCGSSSRPEINYKTNNSLENFETWFTDSLENWRLQRRLTVPENNLVVAHSLGAYLLVCYNIKYPRTFKKLVLASPAGMIKPINFELKKIPKWFDYLWNKNISPFALVRYSGPFGSLFVSGWTSRRFAKLTPQEHDLLHKYAYGIFNARGSGEYFLNYVLSAGGVPRFPLVKNKSRLMKITCETEWLYGENDWMDQRGGQIACKVLGEENGLKANMKVFKGCGHHIYLDDIEGFNNYLIDQIKSF